MTFIILPHEVGTTRATVWVGAIREEEVRKRRVQLHLSNTNDPVKLAEDKWRVWQTFKKEDPSGFAPPDRLLHKLAALWRERPVAEHVHYQRVDLKDLSPRTTYDVNLVIDRTFPTGSGGYLRSCSFRTPPIELPKAGTPSMSCWVPASIGPRMRAAMWVGPSPPCHHTTVPT